MSTGTKPADVDLITSLLTKHWGRDEEFTVTPGDDGGVVVEARNLPWKLGQYAATIREAGIRVRQEDARLAVQVWPYDARRDDPLTALRIPVVGSPYPGWKYEVALVISDDPLEIWGPTLRPDETETALLVSYLEYRMAWYNPGWRAKMRKRPLDVDSGTNTTILVKRGEDDWAYRKATWQYGPTLVPSTYDGQKPVGLAGLLDRINGYFTDGKPRELVIDGRWQEWKAEHPEAFAAEAQT